MFPDFSMSRRHFVKHMTAAGMSLPMLNWISTVQAAREQGKAPKNRSMILLWMGGGPSTIDLWDLKPGSKNGGEFKPIDTTGAGQICEHLPSVAKQMKHLNLIRSYSSREASHERGTYLNHTAYVPLPTVAHPAMGAVIANQIGNKESEIPGHISIGGSSTGPGFLGMAYAPFLVNAGGEPIPNVTPPVDLARNSRRLELLARTQGNFVKEKRGNLPNDQNVILDKAQHLMGSKLLDAFKVENEDAKTRERYGNTEFGRRCLLARRLVELVGAPFVEVGFPGSWDNHQGIFNILAGTGGGRAGMMANREPHLPVLDKAMAALVEDLVERGLWESTTLVWMGEFGRTPRINQDGGRDHWAGNWSVLLGGGSMKGGEVVGKTDNDGMSIVDRPVEPANLFATLYRSVGIEPATELRSPNGRPVKLVGIFGDGKPVEELF